MMLNKIFMCSICGLLLSCLLAVLLAGCSDTTTPTATPDTHQYPTPFADDGLKAKVAASQANLNIGLMKDGEGDDGWLAVGGAAVAGEAINHAGGLSFGDANHYVTFPRQVFDDLGRPDSMASAATQFANELDVAAFIGPNWVEGLMVNQRLMADLNTPELLMVTSETLLSKAAPNPNFFYLRPLNRYWVAAVHDYLLSSGTLKAGLNLGLVYQDNDQWGDAANQTKALLANKDKLAPKVEVKLDMFDGKQFKDHKQYASQVQKLVEANPTVIINWSDVYEASELLLELHQQGWKGQFITTGLGGTFLDQTKAVSEGVVGPASWSPTASDAASQKFIQLYLAYFHTLPDDRAAAVYDGVRLLSEAYKQNGGDRTKIREWLSQLKNWNGLQGNYTTQVDGEMLTSVGMVPVKAGQVTEAGS
jgi:ABC-type branched-subunit amino acid transport system substrate-binding protein